MEADRSICQYDRSTLHRRHSMLPVYDICIPISGDESARGGHRVGSMSTGRGSTTIRFFLEALDTCIEQRARGLHRVVGIGPPIAFSIRVCFSFPSRSRVLPQIR